jgi:hypothetical protein
MFSFNTDKHDFWPIYDAIKQFYPIGIQKNDDDGMYVSYPGIKLLETIIIDNIHNHVDPNAQIAGTPYFKYDDWQKKAPPKETPI